MLAEKTGHNYPFFQNGIFIPKPHKRPQIAAREAKKAVYAASQSFKSWMSFRGRRALEYQCSYLGWAKAAWSNPFGPWIMGAAMFIQDARGKFSAIETLEMLHKYPITTLCAPPTAYRMLVLDEPLAYLKANLPKALRHCVGAGEPLNPEVIKTWQQSTGMTIRDGYGQTETVLLCANFPPLDVKPGSMGKPSSGLSSEQMM